MTHKLSEESPLSLPPIVRKGDAVSRKCIDAFARATRSEHFKDSPPTFPTIFRSTEFEWVDRLRIDLRKLLHTEQEYEYLHPLREGDVPTVITRLTEYRERRGLLFVVLESEIQVAGRAVVLARSGFVVRVGTGETE